jgi:fibronectin-binding autotransporter adhesin
VTNNLPVGGSSPQIQASGGARTLANAFDLNGGLTFTGTNSLSLTGPITIINAAAGGTRTLNNIMTGGAIVTLGSSASPSTITLGNPVANGGDGIGKGIIVTTPAGAVTVINSAIQDVPGAAPTNAGAATFNGAGGTLQLNGMSTYSGGTNLSGAGTIIQIGANSNAPFTAGPFGTGPVTLNNTTNPILQPFGADRTIANAINLTTGVVVSNVTGSAFNMTFSGPIALTAAVNRTVNNMLAPGAMLTLGSAATPSTITLGGTAGTFLIIAGAGATVVNDVIQDAPGVAGNFRITNTSPAGVTINAVNTYTGTTDLTGQGSTIHVGSDQAFGTSVVSLGNNTAPFATLTAAGADRIINNAVTINNNFNVAGANSLTFTGDLTNGAGPNRQINNLITAAGKTLNLNGSLFLSESTTARTVIVNTVAGSTTVINGTVADFAVTGTPGSLTLGSTTPPGGTVLLNGANTYTGQTTLRESVTAVIQTSAVSTGPNPLGQSAAATAANLVINGATLQYAGSAAGTTDRVFQIGANGATLDASGTTPAATFSFTNAGGNITHAGAPARTLTLTGTNTGDNTLGVQLTQATGGTSLAKTGPGTWVLTAANTYAGTTTISDGTLKLSAGGSFASSPTIVVGPTAAGPVLDVTGVTGGAHTVPGTQTVMGFGTVVGNVTVAGTIAPGGSVGTLNFTGDLTLDGTYTAEVVHPAADLVAVTGNLVLSAASVLNLPGTNTYDAGTTYTLATYGGTLTGTFATTPGLPATHFVTYGSGVNSSISLTPVPEPGAVLLTCAAAGWWIARRRRASIEA